MMHDCSYHHAKKDESWEALLRLAGLGVQTEQSSQAAFRLDITSVGSPLQGFLYGFYMGFETNRPRAVKPKLLEPHLRS